VTARALTDEDEDYVLPEERKSLWIEVDDVSIHIRRDGDGVVVDLLPKGDEMNVPLASATAGRFTSDARYEDGGK